MNTNPQQPADKKKTVRYIALLFVLLCILPTVLNITCLTPIYFSLQQYSLFGRRSSNCLGVSDGFF